MEELHCSFKEHKRSLKKENPLQCLAARSGSLGMPSRLRDVVANHGLCTSFPVRQFNLITSLPGVKVDPSPGSRGTSWKTLGLV